MILPNSFSERKENYRQPPKMYKEMLAFRVLPGTNQKLIQIQ